MSEIKQKARSIKRISCRNKDFHGLSQAQEYDTAAYIQKN